MQTVTLTTLHVTGKGPEAEIPLDPAGMTLGRAPSCQIVLDSPKISRRHARIFQDPFGRWIIEDLGSRNGVWIGNQRVDTQAMFPGENILIGPYTVSLAAPQEESPFEIDATATSTSTFIDDGSADPVIAAPADEYDALSGVRLRQLNAIIDRLAELSNPRELYPEVCRSLARSPDAMAIVLRLPTGSQPMPDAPQIVACHFGGHAVGDTDEITENLHISRRVVEAVRTSGKAVMATSTRSSEQDLALTVVDDRRPRAVLCSPLGDVTDTVDALYLDIPSGHATSEMLDFVRAVAMQASFARKSLLLSEAKAERRVLDRQLSLAQEIQANLTPENVQHLAGVDTHICYEPAMWVGGDYCDVWTLEDGRMALAIGDVSGKGLPAAMVMSNLQAALRTTMSFCPRPAEAMGHIDRHLSESMPERMFVTMFLGVFDPHSGTLEYVNAGHILPILVRADRSAHQMGTPTNPPVGVFVGSFEAQSEQIEPDGGVLIVTDGITETMSPEGDEFGPERLQEALNGWQGKTAREMVEIAHGAAKAFRMDLPPQDDITVFALRNCAGAEGQTAPA
jgi:phosphoserine phosphatase RsbU/P